MTASGKHRPMGARELVLLALLGALLLVKLLGFLKKKADQWADDVQMGRGL